MCIMICNSSGIKTYLQIYNNKIYLGRKQIKNNRAKNIIPILYNEKYRFFLI